MLCGMKTALFDDFSVFQMDGLVRKLCDRRLVGDNDHCVVAFLTEALQKVADDAAVGGIQIAGWFVCEEEGAVGIGREIDEQCTRDGGALLLAAGKRVGIMVAAMVKLESLKELRDSGVQFRFVDVMESSKNGKEDVFLRCQRRNQVERLEDDTDVLPSEQRQLMIVEGGEIRAVDDDVA